jgi:hypothetical protein
MGTGTQPARFCRRVRAVPSAAFTNAIVILYAVSALLGVRSCTYSSASPSRSSWIAPAIGQALGLFELKEHFVAFGMALLPAYWICCRKKRADKFSLTIPRAGAVPRLREG